MSVATISREQQLLNEVLELPNNTREVFAEIVWGSVDHQITPLSASEKSMLQTAREEMNTSPQAGIPSELVHAEVKALIK
jgi:hypothetical protein